MVLAGGVLSASTGAAAGAVGLPRVGEPPVGVPRVGVPRVGVPPVGVPRAGERLVVVYDDGSGRPVSRTLRCGGGAAVGGGSEVGDACRRLEALGGPLGPVPAGQMCAMLYGGPQTAHVTGSWHGRPVDETYRRTNGCEVARWNRMVPALPAPGAVPAPGPGARAPGPGSVPGGSGGGVHALIP